MATYKVIQDIEAEDKLVGPLTLRQFIYAGIAVVCLYICFLGLTKGLGFVLVLFLPIAVVTGFFAFPWKGEQPTEIWAMARLRFMIKPRVRVWDQDGVRDIVTITVPKKVESRRSDRPLTENEVHSRLRALADTIDSRGWATRNAAYGPYSQGWTHSTVAIPAVPNSNGLTISMPSDDMFDGQNSVAHNFDAMLAKSSEDKRQRVMLQMSQAQDPQYQQYQQPAVAAPVYAPPAASYQPQPQYQPTYPQQQPQQQQQYQPQYQVPQLPAPVLAGAYQPYQQPVAVAVAAAPAAQPAAYWFANGPAYPANPANPTPVAAPKLPMAPPVPPPGLAARIESDVPIPLAAAPTAEETAMAETIRQQNASVTANYNHMRVLQPIGAGGLGDYPAPNDEQSDNMVDSLEATVQPMTQPPQPVTPPPDPAILELANNDDLDIATIARQAKKEIQRSPDEVEIRLH